MNEMKNEEKTAAATVTNERDAFEAWAQRYDLVAEPNYSEATKVDCWAAWKARAALAATPAATESREELAHRLIGEVKTADSIATAICQRVAELGDLSSPEDWPEAMLVTGDELHLIAREAVIEAQETSAAAAPVAGKSDTHGMNLGQRILHVGGRENAQTYIEFGSIGAVGLLVSQVLRDLPGGAPGFEADFGSAARRYTKDQQDRALLATATGLPAQADDPAVGFEMWWSDHMPNSTQERAFRAWSSLRAAAPQAQADARDADSAARFKSQQDFLNWNRAQQTPPVKIAQEYGVFNNAIDLYRAAIAAAKGNK